MKSLPKLLYLVHRIPYPPNKGDKIRSFHFLQALAKQFEIYLGAFVDDPDDWQYVDAVKNYCVESQFINLQPKIQKLKSSIGMLSGEALSLPYYRSPELQVWVDNILHEKDISRALIFSSPMAQYLDKHPSLHLVADFVDVDSDKWRQYALSKSWPAKWIYNRESEKLLDFEKRIASQATSTLLVSEQEAQLFKTLVPEQVDKIGFVNNGVDTDWFDPDLSYQRPFSADQEAIVFTGAMDYWANVDAVKWFAEQVFPIVKSQRPAARFYIVGSKPVKEVLQLAENDSAITVTGRVEDVRPYVAYAGIVVAPLRIARGIQNKVLEALAMSKVVVATTAAMEGIPSEGDLQLAIADEPIEFADRVASFLEQPIQVATSNRHFVQSDFSWQKNGNKLCHLLLADSRE